MSCALSSLVFIPTHVSRKFHIGSLRNASPRSPASGLEPGQRLGRQRVKAVPTAEGRLCGRELGLYFFPEIHQLGFSPVRSPAKAGS